jgi:hypothetical protein
MKYTTVLQTIMDERRGISIDPVFIKKFMELNPLELQMGFIAP